jgi:hypothetical protein
MRGAFQSPLTGMKTTRRATPDAAVLSFEIRGALWYAGDRSRDLSAAQFLDRKWHYRDCGTQPKKPVLAN